MTHGYYTAGKMHMHTCTEKHTDTHTDTHTHTHTSTHKLISGVDSGQKASWESGSSCVENDGLGKRESQRDRERGRMNDGDENGIGRGRREYDSLDHLQRPGPKAEFSFKNDVHNFHNDHIA